MRYRSRGDVTGTRLKRYPPPGLMPLFGMLHGNEATKEIHVSGNPGTDGCDRSIVGDKGREVFY